MNTPMKAVLLETTNPIAGTLKGQMGYLYAQVGARAAFDGLLTSVVEGIVWFNSRIEVHTRNSRYVFLLQQI